MPFSHLFSPALIVFAVLSLAGFATAQEVSVLSRTLKGQRLNELGIWNLGSGPVFEIFVTSVAGKAACFRADNLEPLWEKEIARDALTAPVMGNLMGDNSPVLAFGSASGVIYFLWPGTGETIATLNTEMSFAVPPSIAAFGDHDAVVLGDEQGRIAVAALAGDSRQAQLFYSIPNTLPGTTAFSVIGSFSQSPTCADLDLDGTPEVITASDSGVLQVVSFPRLLSGKEAPKRYHTRLAQQSRATTLIAAGSLSTDQSRLLALGVDASIHLYSWNPSQLAENEIQAVLQAPAYGASLGHLLLAPINADDVPDLISTANNTVAARYLGRDLKGQQILLDIPQRHLSTTAPPFSPAVSFTGSDGNQMVLSIDNEGTVWEWLPSSPDNTMKRHSGMPVPTGFTPAGNLKGDGKLSMVVWNEQSFQLSVVSLPIDIPAGAAPLLTAGGNYSRDGQRGKQWAARWEKLRASSTERLKQAKAALEQNPEDSKLPTDPASLVAGIDPDDPIAADIRSKHSSSKKPVAMLLMILTALVFAAIGFLFWRRSRR